MTIEYPSLMRPWHERYQGVATGNEQGSEEAMPSRAAPSDPEDLIQQVHSASVNRLGRDLLGRLLAQPPVFFEQIIVDLMVAMGYGNRRRDVARRIGQSGDGGVDGVIELDELGLDLVYLQAKRYRPGLPVPVNEVRDFIGALEARHSRKGVMVTTSYFTKAARQIVERVQHRIVLIDNNRLAELMIRHNIGVRVDRSIQFKTVNPDYFVVTAERAFAGSETIDLRSLLQAMRRG